MSPLQSIWRPPNINTNSSVYSPYVLSFVKKIRFEHKGVSLEMFLTGCLFRILLLLCVYIAVVSQV